MCLKSAQFLSMKNFTFNLIARNIIRGHDRHYGISRMFFDARVCGTQLGNDQEARTQKRQEKEDDANVR